MILLTKYRLYCRIPAEYKEERKMKDHLRIGRWLAALVIVAGLLTVGGREVQAKEMETCSKASELTAGETYSLKGNTTLTMDKDVTLKQIKGNFPLKIKGSGTLTLTGVSGDYALYVKDLTIDDATIKIHSSNGTVYGLYANETSIDNGTVDIDVVGEEYKYGFIIQGKLTVTGGSELKINTKISNAIQVNDSLDISGSKVTAKSDARIAVRSAAVLNIEDGSEIDANGGTHGIFSMGSLNVSGNKTYVKTRGGTGYGLFSDSSNISIGDNAVVTVLDGGVAADTFISVYNAELHANSTQGTAMMVFTGSSSTPVQFVDSEIVLVSGKDYGIRADGSTGNSVLVSGSSVSIQSDKDGILTNMSFDIMDSKVNIVSTNGMGICAGSGSDGITDSDITVSGKTYGILTDKDLILKNSTMKVTATGSGSSDTAIESQNGKIKYEKNDLFIKTPDNGRTKTNGGSGQIIKGKDGNPAKIVEFIKAIALKEIRFEFPAFYDGEPIDGEFKITSVPAGAIHSDAIVETIKKLVEGGNAKSYYQESEDGKTFKDPGSTKYGIDKYYQTTIPAAETAAIKLAIALDLETVKNPIWDRNKVQFIPSDLKVYVNGKEYNGSFLDEKTKWVDVGKAVGSIKKAKIADIAAQEYTGKAITPEPAVTYNGKTLKKGTDYTLTYKSNTGDPKTKTTATVTVTGKGSYALSANKTFTIEHTKHVKGEGKVAKEPTTEAVGTREFCCTICGKVLETEEIAKLEAPSTADAPLSPENAISLKKAEKALKKVTGYKDPKTAKFGLLQAKAKKVGKNYVTLGWTKVKGAEYYVIYGNKCSKKNKYLKLTTAKASAKSKKIKKIAGKKLKKGTYYKFIIAAVAKDSKGVDKVIACSTSVHFITKGNAKYGDFTKVRLKSKKSVTIKVGKTHKIKATQVKPKNLKVQQHRKLSYESNNKAVATVSKKGKVKGISKGKAIIYVYAQNGIFAKVNVTVE